MSRYRYTVNTTHGAPNIERICAREADKGARLVAACPFHSSPTKANSILLIFETSLLLAGLEALDTLGTTPREARAMALADMPYVRRFLTKRRWEKKYGADAY
jgi:hypothetical protein